MKNELLWLNHVKEPDSGSTPEFMPMTPTCFLALLLWLHRNHGDITIETSQLKTDNKLPGRMEFD